MRCLGAGCRNYVFGTFNWLFGLSQFNFNAADMNSDGTVNAADIVNIVNAIGEGR